MSVSVTIRHVPDHTRDLLAQRASRSGRSLQEYLLNELERLAREPSIDDWLSSAREFAKSNSQESADLILSDLDADRR
ncbi:MAG: FitA-like ribbon-helix-helix domain-containing protein [Ancrocorticia sp.]|uniref:FitA-like ribbon-helix-helix domain-containing protein n=1 Tax=Ancrocorticia sp. TaxID=2593684 RepID=UPI003F901B3C